MPSRDFKGEEGCLCVPGLLIGALNLGERAIPGPPAGEVQRRPALRDGCDPFAFLIDPQGVIATKGIINNGQHIGFVLSRAHPQSKGGVNDSELFGTERGVPDEFHSHSQVKEVSHV